MGRKSRDIPTKISFKTEKVHTVLFDPEQTTEDREGERGPYEVILVQENGGPAMLPYSSQRLIKGINALNLQKPTMVRITQTGSGMETSYAVEALQTPSPQAKR